MVNSPPGEDHWSWAGAHLADGQNLIQMRRGLFWKGELFLTFFDYYQW